MGAVSVRFRVTYTRFAELREDVEQQMARGGLLVKLTDDYAHDTPITLEVVMPDGVVLAGASRVLQVLAGYGVAVSVGEDLVEMARLACNSGDDTGRSGDARHERVDDGSRAPSASRPPFETRTPPHGARSGFETRTPPSGSRGFETRTPAHGSRGGPDARTPRAPFESKTPSHGASRDSFESRTPSQGASRDGFESRTPSQGSRPPFESRSSPGLELPTDVDEPRASAALDDPKVGNAEDARPRSNPAIELPRTATTSRPPSNARTATRSGPYIGPPIVETSRVPTRSRAFDSRSADADELLPSAAPSAPSLPSAPAKIGETGDTEPAGEPRDPFAVTFAPYLSSSKQATDMADAMPPVPSRVPTSSQPAIVPPAGGSPRAPLSSNPRIHPIDAATLASIDAALDTMQPPWASDVADHEAQPETTRARATKPPYDEMTNAEKIQVALHGNRDERNLVLRDRNRMLHAFVLKNPAINLDDVTTIAKNAQMGPDVLKQISERKEWFQRPAVATALARNPKTPADIAIRALDYVPMDVLRQMAKGVGALPHVTQAARKKVIPG